MTLDRIVDILFSFDKLVVTIKVPRHLEDMFVQQVDVSLRNLNLSATTWKIDHVNDGRTSQIRLEVTARKSKCAEFSSSIREVIAEFNSSVN